MKARIVVAASLLALLLPPALAGPVAGLRIGRPAAPAAEGDKPGQPTGYIAKAPAAPKIDGQIDEPAWQAAHVLRIAWTLDGSAPANVPAEIRLLRDDKTLYVSARCDEPFAAKIRAGQKGHDDGLWDDDSVEMFIGTDDDFDYFHIIVNSIGAVYDGFNKDAKWDGAIVAKGHVGKDYWSAEWAIPLEKLKFAGRVPEKWIANFTRNRQTRGRGEELAWSPTFSRDSHEPRKFGRLLMQDPPPEVLAAQKPATLPPGVSILPADGGQGIVRFDLSALPKGAKVVRADLVLSRTGAITGRDDEIMVEPEIYPLTAAGTGGTGFQPVQAAPAADAKPLAIRPPWFDSFDATAAVQGWASGQPNGGFLVKAFPLWNAAASHLDVLYEAPPKDVPPQATGVKVAHRAGQTFITWKEIEDLLGGTPVMRWGELRRILGSMDARRQVRYRVYRSDSPITPDSLAQAELIATVRPLSCWNVNGRNLERPIDEAMAGYALVHGQWNPFVDASVDGEYGLRCPIDRLVIEDGQGLLPRGTGLYVHTVAAATKGYYAVVTVIDGAPNTRDLSADSAPAAVDETPAPPAPVFQRELPPRPFWNLPEKRLHYVQFATPPLCNLPSQYYNWTVAVPNQPAERMPLELSLHREGRSYWATQYRLSARSLVLIPHDFPLFSVWYGYHESLGTLRSFRQGTVQPYTERRIMAFIDWAATKWPMAKSGGVATGSTAGAASGAAMLARRHPEVFARASARGQAGRNYAAIARDTGPLAGLGAQMQALWGQPEWGLKTDSGKSVWQELGGK